VHYRRFFSREAGTGAEYAGKSLVAHAAVALHAGNCDDARRVLDALELDGTAPRVRGQKVGVGVLIYNATCLAKKWELGSLAWLEHASSWRP